MNDDIDGIYYVLNKITEEGFKHFRPEKSILTEKSKEVTLQGNSIIISPIEKCISISIRGATQSAPNYVQPYKIESLIDDFRYYIKNKEKNTDESYEMFIKRRLLGMSDCNPHFMCLYLEDSEGELREDYNDKVNISIVRNVNVTESSKRELLVNRTFYLDFKSVHLFNQGVSINKNDSIEIKAFRNKEPIEIKKFKLYLECDRWYKRE